MRILVLSFETPTFPGGGGQSRQHSILERLAPRHDIRVLTTGGPALFGRCPEGVDVRLLSPGPYVAQPRRGWLVRNWNHFVHGPPAVLDHAGPHVLTLAEAAEESMRTFVPDVIQVEHGEFGALVPRLAPRAPTVLVLHNVITELQAHRIAGGPRRRVSGALETALVARYERRYIRAAHTVVVVNRRGERAVRRLGRPHRLRVVPNCIPVDHFARTAERAPRPTVIFSASFHYQPNQIAALELLRDVLPRVRTAVPDVELVLAGQQMPDSLAAEVAATCGARATGTVEDIRPELHGAWVALAPLRHGSGSPIKVMEALASGVPVVATPQVVRMLDLGRADGVLAARRPEDVARSVIRVLHDAGLREEMARRGVSVARARFDCAHAAQLQEEVWTAAREEGERVRQCAM